MSELPRTWKQVKLGEVSVSRMGKTILSKELTSEGMPVFSASTGAEPWGYTSDKSVSYYRGTVIISARGTIGDIKLPDYDQFVSTQTTIATVPPAGIESEFLMHALRTVDWPSFTATTAIPMLTIAKLNDVPIAVPPTAEQQRIVAKIDSLSGKSRRARDHLDHIPRLVKKYKQAVLTAAFRGDLTRDFGVEGDPCKGWVEAEIGDIAKIVTGSTPPTKDRSYYGGEHPFVKPGDLDGAIPISGAENSLSDVGLGVSRELPPGTVLVSCIGNLGKVGLLAVRGSCNQQINAILPGPYLLPRFTYYWAKSLTPWLQENSSATTVAIINKGRFSRAPIRHPRLEEQAKVVRRLESAFTWIDRLAAEATSARRLIDRLDQAVLAKAFRGELVPQDPDDEPASVLLERIRAERATAPKPRRGRRASVA